MALLALSGIEQAARAQAAPHLRPMARPTSMPAVLNDVGIDQRLDAQVPLDAAFLDESGNPIKLGDCFGERPVILALVYYECPMLCTMVLNDLRRALNAMSTSAGEDFDIVTISFDPAETPKLAADKKLHYLRGYRRPKAEQGWHFLTGPEPSIHAVTDAVGFRYAWDEKHKQYVHASGVMVLTPQGRVSRYFYGLDYSARDLRLATAEASGGKIGSPAEQVMLYCFEYDPSTGRYGWAVTRLLQTAAVLTMAALGTFWLVMYRRDKRAADVRMKAEG